MCVLKKVLISILPNLWGWFSFVLLSMRQSLIIAHPEAILLWHPISLNAKSMNTTGLKGCMIRPLILVTKTLRLW